MQEETRPRTRTGPLRRGVYWLMLLMGLLACALMLARRGCLSTDTQPKPPRPEAPEAPPWTPGKADSAAVRPAASASRPDLGLAPPYSPQTDQKPADKGPADLGLPIDVVIKDVPKVPEKIARPSPPIDESP